MMVSGLQLVVGSKLAAINGQPPTVNGLRHFIRNNQISTCIVQTRGLARFPDGRGEIPVQVNDSVRPCSGVDLHSTSVDEADGGEKKNIAVFVFELPIAQVNLSIAEITQDDDLRAEVVRAHDADDLNVAVRVGNRLGDGRGRPKVRWRRKRGDGGSRLQISVVPKDDRPRHAGGDQRVQQKKIEQTAAVHAG